MVTKSQIKLVASLQQKKFRKQYRMFIAEGKKIIQELLDANYELEFLFSTKDQFVLKDSRKYHAISENELKKMSALKTQNDCLAVFKMKEQEVKLNSGLIVVLDDVRDPGNFGTIIRLCDWFGIETIVCSNETADLYNPKVIQATMGSFTRVAIVYKDLEEFLMTTQLPIYGTFMDGNNVYSERLPIDGIIIMGNEANGISDRIEKRVDNRITIPRFGLLQQTESLNVATATAIILSEFRRGFSGT